MPTHSDDIAPLFDAFGGDNKGYREFARTEGAEEAVARWPMLQSMAPAARERTAALSGEQRQRRIGNREAIEVAEELPQSMGRGQKLSDGLNQLNGLKCAEVLRATASVLTSSHENPSAQLSAVAHGQPPVSSLGAGLAAAGLRPEAVGRDNATPESVSASAQFSPTQHASFPNLPVSPSIARERAGIFNRLSNSPLPASGGLFAKTTTTPSSTLPPAAKLGELFSRLAGKTAGGAVSNTGRSILSFLGRRAGR